MDDAGGDATSVQYHHAFVLEEQHGSVICYAGSELKGNGGNGKRKTRESNKSNRTYQQQTMRHRTQAFGLQMKSVHE